MNEKKDLFEETFDSLWETENYNFGTIDEDGYYDFDDYTEYPFAIEEMSILNNEYQKLKQQLKTYKDKEDKIREYLEELKITTYDKRDGDEEMEHILQILNEGDK